MRRRREWFERMQEACLALWWIPAGHRSSVDAFTFRKAFPPPDATRTERTIDLGNECPAT
jgi:hypothetical protein